MMKHSSIHLWFIGIFMAAALAPAGSAQAGWRDGSFFDPGWFDDDPPPVYEHGRRMVRPPRDGGIVARMPDGEVVVVYPEDEYGDVLVPDPAPRRVVRPRPRIEALRPPASVGEEPVVVPGIAPERVAPRRPVRIVPDKPRPTRVTRDAALVPPAAAAGSPVDAGLAEPGRKPAQAEGATPRIVPVNPPRQARQVQARIALPVPRPNLESMDFAPSAPLAAPPPEDRGDRSALADKR